MCVSGVCVFSVCLVVSVMRSLSYKGTYAVLSKSYQTYSHLVIPEELRDIPNLRGQILVHD